MDTGHGGIIPASPAEVQRFAGSTWEVNVFNARTGAGYRHVRSGHHSATIAVERIEVGGVSDDRPTDTAVKAVAEARRPSARGLSARRAGGGKDLFAIVVNAVEPRQQIELMEKTRNRTRLIAGTTATP